MDGAIDIYNVLILIIIFFAILWIKLWKTMGIKCGIKGAGCPVRQRRRWSVVGEITLIRIKTTGYVDCGVVPTTQCGNCHSQPGMSYSLCITWRGTV
jgi:hypothetical protein